MSEYRGSEWRKWDLHVHTPASYTQQFGGDWDKYVEKLKQKAKEHDIAVMGVTDYFSIDGYEKLTNEYEPKGEPRLLLEGDQYLELLPCIELRLDNFTDKGNSVNLHILFDSNIQTDVIRNYFLYKLKFKYRGTDLTLNRETLIRVGSSALEDTAFNPNLAINGFDENRAKDCISRALSVITLDLSSIEEKLDEIKKILAEKDIYLNRNYLLAIAAKGHGSLEEMPWFIDDVTSGNKSKENEIKIDLLNRASVVFTRADSNVAFMHGKDEKCKLDEFISKFGSIKACIWGSDAHDLDILFHPSAGSTSDYTWIKADPTFEGLRQIILEPEFRVRIQSNIPQGPIYKLESIALDFPDSTTIDDGDIPTSFCFDGLKNELHLSPYFNCFIGGRGVGKSTLLNLIDDYYSEENEKIEELVVRDRNGDELELVNYLSIDGGDSSAASIDFVSQNNIERLATNLAEFTSYIYGRVKKHGGNDLEPYEESISEVLNTAVLKIEWLTELKLLEQNITKLSKEIISKEKMVSSVTDERYIELTNAQKSAIENKTSIQLSRQKLEGLTKEIDELLMAQDIQDNAQEDNLFHEKFKQLLDAAKGLISPYKNTENFDDIFKADIEKTNNLTKEIEDINKEIKEFLKGKGVHPDNIEDLTIANNEISELKAERENNELDRERILEKIKENSGKSDAKERLEEILNNSIATVNDDLAIIRGDSVEIEDIRLEYRFDNDSASTKFIEEVRILLKEDHELRQLPDARVIKRNLLTESCELQKKQNLLIALKDGDDSDTETVKLLRNYIAKSHNYEILQNAHKKQFDNVQEFMRLKVMYGGKSIEATSFGQRCAAALIILLALGNHPIIIDEPEAHLDGSLIANYLVGILKRLKERRQIIFATHNANFVINGDADLIYVMESDHNNSTQFLPATIENKAMRNKLLKLEGGPEAFIKRDKRYSVKV